MIHHNKDIFGEDASDFRPERWLCDLTETIRLDQNFLAVSLYDPYPYFFQNTSPWRLFYLSRTPLTIMARLKFGSGPRTCLGKNISMLELSKVIPEMVLHFDFELVGRGGEWKTLNRWFVKSSYECMIFERKEAF